MKLVRFLDRGGRERCGRLTAGADEVEVLRGPTLVDKAAPTGEVLRKDAIGRYLWPVECPNVVAIGQNYREHAREMGKAVPAEPKIFLKATTCLNGHGGEIRLPKAAPEAVDWEAELVVVLAREARDVPEQEADQYVLGYTCGNDVTARDCQKRDEQWARAKSFDTFGPMGPWIETDLTADAAQDLAIRSVLNGQIMQESRTADMIFSVRRLVSYVSRMMTLRAGTAIYTGTPPGIGMARQPAVFLRDGDEIAVEIEGIGRLVNRVVG
ncbi:MAG: fumarylacetoacetate hydrolase family protein [Sedimentisphaerales bacterium]|nr:fumarylacetoacetate hydrolase family protein [Sedimentisphaerales bacterium]